MKYIYIGDIVNTHGIKGELRIISDFKYKNQVFKQNFTLYVGRSKEKMIIESYRKHKEYDMVVFYDIGDINDAIAYKGDKVYINRDDIKINGYFNEDLIGLEVYGNDNFIGKVETIMKSSAHDIIIVKSINKKHMIPYVNEFIKSIDLNNNRIDINVIEGLIDEN